MYIHVVTLRHVSDQSRILDIKVKHLLSIHEIAFLFCLLVQMQCRGIMNKLGIGLCRFMCVPNCI